MSKKARQFLYFGVALILAGVALTLVWLSSTNPTSQANLPTPPPAITAPPALALPTMGYGPLEQTPISQPKPASQNLATAVPSAAANLANTSLSSADLSDRFGLIVTGLNGVPDPAASFKHLLDVTGSHWWYQYDPILPEQPNSQQVYIVRVYKDGETGSNYQYWLNFLKTKISLQHSYWVIGNEPNVPGQDDTPPDLYARSLHDIVAVIKGADPNATIIGPNTLNWEYTCKGCPGYTPGRTWFEQMQAAYQNLYQAALPFTAYSLHTYSLDWDTLPLLNHDRDVEQITQMRNFLDANPDTRNKPIWLTEFGVIWGYDGLDWKQDSAGNWKAVPKGNLRTDLITSYLNDTFSWLKTNAVRLNLARWFVYTSYGLPEPFTDTFSGISLVDSNTPQANLTNYGKIYASYLKGN